MSPISRTTPGIYTEEIAAFPNTIFEVETAVPAFVGYTLRASSGRRSLRRKPTRISSYSEYLALFGALTPEGTPASEASQISPRFQLLPAASPTSSDFTLGGKAWNLQADATSLSYFHLSLKLFFSNGGGSCFIVSVGRLAKKKPAPDTRTNPNVKLADLLAGLAALEREAAATMIVVPDASLLGDADYSALCQATLLHCQRMQSRIALLDVRGADSADPQSWSGAVASFRSAVGDVGLEYGAAYFPFLRTTLLVATDATYLNLGGPRALNRALPDAKAPLVKTVLADMRASTARSKKSSAPSTPSAAELDARLRSVSPAYSQIHALLLDRLNTLPPSGAMAGAITLTDHSAGVWKAPANIGLADVKDLSVQIDQQTQENLNVDPATGKSINVIRSFVGRGILVWGARTLAGNSQDWRYINVRRTAIMVEQSIKGAMSAFVFEPNDANTWSAIRALIENFLITLWKQGALVGEKPENAFAVRIGLGTTMTAQDILDGNLIVQVYLAPVRPAEFVVLSFRQQMPKPGE